MEGRRGTLRRLLERMRRVVRRRRGGKNDVQALGDQQTGASGLPQTTADGAPKDKSETPAGIPEQTPLATSQVQQTEPQPDKPAPTSTIDGSQASAVNDDMTAALPIRSSRSPFSEDKRRALIEKYGYEYDGVPTLVGLKDKNQRVERPIRVRLHWKCHECKTAFGMDKVCPNCGHEKCRECSREPAKRVKEALEQAEAEQENQPSNVDALQPDDRLVEDLSPNEADLYVSQPRPSAVRLVSGDDISLWPRRTCHECQTQFSSPSQDECGNCKHKICSRCPREPPIRRALYAYGQLEDEAPQPTNTVRRVYRKPRQRVRWSCHECSATFADGKVCKNCGHERCRKCMRTPSKQAIEPTHPSVLQSVTDKLANLGGLTQQSDEVAAAAS